MRAKGQRVAETERRRQIIRVATELFARQGFKVATTRQIAQQARINEAILLRHFPQKEDLDWTIIDQQN
jgi:AcrR family transcriptional regulator